MSEFDQLKNDAEKEVKEHPEEVQKGEQAAEKKLGLPEQGGDQPSQGAQDQGQQDQGQQNQSQQDQSQQDQGSGSQGDQNPAGQGQ